MLSSAAFFCHLANMVIFFFLMVDVVPYSYISDPNRQLHGMLSKGFLVLCLLSPVLALVVFCNRRSPTPLSKAATALAFVFIGAFVVALLYFFGIYDLWWGASCFVMHSEGLGGLNIRPVSSGCANWSNCGDHTCCPSKGYLDTSGVRVGAIAC